MRIVKSGVLLLAIAAMATPSLAKSYKSSKVQRPVVREAPLKDCTRVNGRWGYYGNLWCTPAEQLAWDRAEARRLGR